MMNCSILNVRFRLIALIIAGFVATPCFADFMVSKNAVAEKFLLSNQSSVAIKIGWTTSPETGEDILAAQLTYQGSFAKKSVRWIQTARIQNNDDTNFIFNGFQEDRNNNRSENGYFLDQNYDVCSTDLSRCSYFYRDHFENPNESQESDNIAQIADFPFGWANFKKIQLESCAYNLITKQFEICLRWGAEWPLTSDRIIFKPVLSQSPTSDFLEALYKFKKFYGVQQ